MLEIPPDSQGFVYVPVPQERVAEVYELLAGEPKGAADVGVDRQRLRLLERIYRESDVGLRSLLRYLSKRPERPVTTTKVAKDLELPRGASSLAGMLGAFARRSQNRYDGYTPIETTYNPVRDATELFMPQAEAEAIQKLIRKRKAVKRVKSD